MKPSEPDIILSGKNEAAVELGRRGGLARAAKLTPEERREIARRAANARWAKRRAMEATEDVQRS